MSHTLGDDGLKDCFREPIPEVFEAANILSDALSAHLRGDASTAEKAILAADMPIIGEWLDSLWLGPWQPPYRGLVKVENLPPILPKADRFVPRDPSTAMKRDLIARDGHHCRLCGIPLVRAEVRKRLGHFYPRAVRWTGARAADQHRGLQVMWLQYDHVVVHSRGGETSLENLVVTCPGCNFGRDRFSLEEVCLRDPRTHRRYPSWDGWMTWDGLETILPEKDQFLIGCSSMSPSSESHNITISLKDVPAPTSVRFDEASMWVELADGRTLGMPLAWYPRLKDAEPDALNDYFLTPSGVHWETLDEDLSIRGMLLGLKDQTALPARAA